MFFSNEVNKSKRVIKGSVNDIVLFTKCFGLRFRGIDFCLLQQQPSQIPASAHAQRAACPPWLFSEGASNFLSCVTGFVTSVTRFVTPYRVEYENTQNSTTNAQKNPSFNDQHS